MTERIVCIAENCKRTILPTTAYDTGGYCMACVQKQRHDEQQAYIKEHKKKGNYSAPSPYS